MKHLMLAILVASVMLFTASGASAHVLTVTPAGQDEPVFKQGISRPFAQAHCHAQAPAQATASSGGTVAFNPAGIRACPEDAENPGGQTTGP